MSKDLYSEMCVHFGVDSLKKSVDNRRNRFINRYGETDKYYLCQMLRWSRSFCLAVFLLRLFNFCSLYLFIYFVLPNKMVK